MARRPRLEFPGALYHILTRGNRKEPIFIKEGDYHKFLQFLFQYQRRDHFRLFAYVLMPNHYHLLLETSEVPLSKIMQGLNQRYTQFFNRRYQKVGHLFQGRYKAIVCDKDSYLWALIRYIHLNPVRSGLVRQADQYPWSSHPIYLGQKHSELIDPQPVLALFSSRWEEAVKNYAQFINETASTEHRPEFYESEILGDEDFYKQMEILRMHAPVAFKDLPSLPDLINFICGEAEITKEQLTAVGRVRRNAHLRALVGLLAKECGLASLKEISAIFQRDVTSMSKAITNLEHRLERDVYLQKLYNRVNDFLDRKIAK